MYFDTTIVVTLVKDDLENFLRTLDSVSSQTVSPRHLVIDSSAFPIEISTERSSSNLVILRTPPAGIYQGMNFALEWVLENVTSNPYIYFLNSGDVFYQSSSLERVLMYAEQMSVVYGKYLVVDEETNSSLLIDPIHWKRWRQLFSIRPISHQAIFIKKDVFGLYGTFDTSYKIGADWELILRISTEVEFKYVDVVISKFYLGGFSSQNRSTANDDLKRLRSAYGPSNFSFKSVDFIFGFWRNVRLLIFIKLLQKNILLLKLIRHIRGWK
jgi:hypothetical protein